MPRKETALTREEIILLVKEKQLKQAKAAKLLNVSVRQIKRLCQHYRQYGVEALYSKRRGLPAKNRISTRIQKSSAIGTNKIYRFWTYFSSREIS